jgi:hypothetical protein
MKKRKVVKGPASAATDHGPKSAAHHNSKCNTGSKTTQGRSVRQRRSRSKEPEANPILLAALDYLRRGFSVIPIRPGTKKCALPRWKEYQSRLASEAEVNRWFTEHPDWQLGIVLGEVSGGVVVGDFDDMAEHDRWAEEYPECAATLPTVVTARGRHVYCRSADTRSHKVTGGEIRGDGNYVLAPPSKHPAGADYAWMIPLPGDGDVPEVDLVETGLLPPPPKKSRKARRKPTADGDMPLGLSHRTQRFIDHGADEGCRNHELFVASCNLAALGVSRERAEVMLRRGCRLCYPPFEGDEIRRTIDSAYSKVRKLPNSSGVLFNTYVIPRAIAMYPGLPDSAKLVWGALDYRQRASFCCFPSVATIGKDVGRSEDAARKAVQRLERAGLLTVMRSDGAVNRYITHLPHVASDDEDMVSSVGCPPAISIA